MNEKKKTLLIEKIFDIHLLFHLIQYMLRKKMFPYCPNNMARKLFPFARKNNPC